MSIIVFSHTLIEIGQVLHYLDDLVAYMWYCTEHPGGIVSVLYVAIDGTI